MRNSCLVLEKEEGNILMISYIIQGIWEAKNSVLSGIILFLAAELVLILVKKRTFQVLQNLPKRVLLCELLLAVYLCTMLKITGMTGREYRYDFSLSELSGFIRVPFAGASMKMVILNLLLFVPYGILVYVVFLKFHFDWKKAFLIGFFSSFTIEVIQAFTGRMAENDDLIANTVGFMIGFFLAEGSEWIICRKNYKKGMVKSVLTILISCISLFFLSFAADGDSAQEEENAYYNGIGSPDGTLDDETASIIEMNIYKNGTRYDAMGRKSDWDSWYMSMGTDINNRAGLYGIIRSSDTAAKDVIQPDKTYMEIVFKEPKTFHFYNNHSWNMERVRYLLYCIENGDFWYGTKKDSVQFLAKYDSSEYQYDRDKDLADDIDRWRN